MDNQLKLDVFDIINLCQAVGMALDVTNKEIKEFPNLEKRLSLEKSKFENLEIRLNNEYKRLANL